MKPDLLLKILRENKYKVQFEKMTKQSSPGIFEFHLISHLKKGSV